MRVAIAGAGGGVGASVAFNLLLSPLECEVVMLDARPRMVRSHLWDLEQVLEQGATGTVREGTPADVADADVLVMAAAAPLTVNTSRMVYLHDNAAILAPLLDAVAGGWPGLLILVTNPVDPLATWAAGRTGLPRERLLGYTVNDSLRLRTAIGQALGARPGQVEAWMIGEHGDLAVPLLHRVRVAGRPVTLSDEQRDGVRRYVQGWYARHVALDSGRSSTWTSGLGITRMIRACLADVDSDPPTPLWPASVRLAGEYGLDGVSLSVPVRLGGGGMREVVEWELTAEQRAGLAEGARVVREAAATLG